MTDDRFSEAQEEALDPEHHREPEYNEHAFCAGREAAADGIPFSMNPHDRGTNAYKSWMAGHFDEQAIRDGEDHPGTVWWERINSPSSTDTSPDHDSP
jgi:hypothetical protein